MGIEMYRKTAFSPIFKRSQGETYFWCIILIFIIKTSYNMFPL